MKKWKRIIKPCEDCEHCILFFIECSTYEDLVKCDKRRTLWMASREDAPSKCKFHKSEKE